MDVPALDQEIAERDGVGAEKRGGEPEGVQALGARAALQVKQQRDRDRELHGRERRPGAERDCEQIGAGGARMLATIMPSQWATSASGLAAPGRSSCIVAKRCVSSERETMIVVTRSATRAPTSSMRSIPSGPAEKSASRTARSATEPPPTSSRRRSTSGGRSEDHGKERGQHDHPTEDGEGQHHRHHVAHVTAEDADQKEYQPVA